MKKILIWSSAVIILLIIMGFMKVNTNVYLAFEGEPIPHTVTVTAKVDGEIIFDNITLSPVWSGINVKLEKIPLRMGFHKIEAFSKSENVSFEKNVFILFNHHIMIEYWEGGNNFTVRTGFNPFRFE